MKAPLLAIFQASPLLRDILVNELRKVTKGFLQRVLIHLRVSRRIRQPIEPGVLGGPQVTGARRELLPGNAIGVTEKLLPLPGEVIPGTAVIITVFSLGGGGGV